MCGPFEVERWVYGPDLCISAILHTFGCACPLVGNWELISMRHQGWSWRPVSIIISSSQAEYHLLANVKLHLKISF